MPTRWLFGSSNHLFRLAAQTTTAKGGHVSLSLCDLNAVLSELLTGDVLSRGAVTDKRADTGETVTRYARRAYESKTLLIELSGDAKGSGIFLPPPLIAGAVCLRRVTDALPLERARWELDIAGAANARVPDELSVICISRTQSTLSGTEEAELRVLVKSLEGFARTLVVAVVERGSADDFVAHYPQWCAANLRRRAATAARPYVFFVSPWPGETVEVMPGFFVTLHGRTANVRRHVESGRTAPAVDIHFAVFGDEGENGLQEVGDAKGRFTMHVDGHGCNVCVTLALRTPEPLAVLEAVNAAVSAASERIGADIPYGRARVHVEISTEGMAARKEVLPLVVAFAFRGERCPRNCWEGARALHASLDPTLAVDMNALNLACKAMAVCEDGLSELNSVWFAYNWHSGITPLPIFENRALFLGCALNVTPFELNHNGIRRVVSILGPSDRGEMSIVAAAKAVMPHITFVHKVLPDDGRSAFRLFGEVCDVIDEGIAAGERVLVHCAAGMSRSPSCVMAYLMHSCAVPLSEAFGMVARHRNILVGASLVCDLVRWEERCLGAVATVHAHADLPYDNIRSRTSTFA